MAEAFTGVRPYARTWLHVARSPSQGAKMAKSAGNLVLHEELLAGYPAAVIRLMILDRPWAQHWDYRPGLLDDVGGQSWSTCIRRPGAPHPATRRP
jgi:cysteinyl-tRNA synthetase